MTRRTSIQLIKYVAVGGAAALVEWTSFAVLVGPLHFHYLAAVFVNFITAAMINFVLSAQFLF